jgi:hypothetical protein
MSAPHQPPPRARLGTDDRSAGFWKPWLASLGLHLLAVAVWMLTAPDPGGLGGAPAYTEVTLLELPHSANAVDAPEPEPDDPAPAPSEAGDRPIAPQQHRRPTSDAGQQDQLRGPGEDDEPVHMLPSESSAKALNFSMAALKGSKTGTTKLALSGAPSYQGPIDGGSAAGSGGPSTATGPMPSRTPASDMKPRSFVEAGFKPRSNGTMVYRAKGFPFKAILHPNGRIEFKGKVPLPASMPGVSDALLHGNGEELYQAQKKKLLDDTFELRLGMAVAWTEARLEERLAALTRELFDVWIDGSRSRPARREILFERWDECDTLPAPKIDGFEPASRIDDVRRGAGRRARAKIEQFIRKHLPRSSEHAYTPEELARLNARRHSRARFDPYGDRDELESAPGG